jgi:hypothetical protein
MFLVPPYAGLFVYLYKIMYEKKTAIFKSPDLSKLKEVIIDHRTRIYVALEVDPVEAKNRYLFRISTRRP